jgi:hypothetical protein
MPIAIVPPAARSDRCEAPARAAHHGARRPRNPRRAPH